MLKHSTFTQLRYVNLWMVWNREWTTLPGSHVPDLDMQVYASWEQEIMWSENVKFKVGTDSRKTFLKAGLKGIGPAADSALCATYGLQ